MAFEENVNYASTYLADEDLSAKQFFGAKLSADGQIAAATDSTENLIGIISNKPLAGRTCKIATLSEGSTYKVQIGASETIIIGDPLIPAADGWAKGASTNRYHLIAREAVTTAGGASAIISALCVPVNVVA